MQLYVSNLWFLPFFAKGEILGEQTKINLMQVLRVKTELRVAAVGLTGFSSNSDSLFMAAGPRIHGEWAQKVQVIDYRGVMDEEWAGRGTIIYQSFQEPNWDIPYIVAATLNERFLANVASQCSHHMKYRHHVLPRSDIRTLLVFWPSSFSVPVEDDTIF